MVWRLLVAVTLVSILAVASSEAPARARPVTLDDADPAEFTVPLAVASAVDATALDAPPVAAAVPAGCGSPRDPGDSVESISTDQGNRTFRMHLPPGYDAEYLTPLVLNFHGYGRSALEQETYSGLVPLADREGFVLVTPEGSGAPPAWDIVGVYAEDGVDDVYFTVQLINHLSGVLCVDPHRVYATGLSNGAQMASQVACLLPAAFAAVAPVAGVIYQDCDEDPVPVIAFHGTQDENVPFEFARPAVAEWARHNGCSDEELVQQVSEHVVSEAYLGCNDVDTVLYVIEGGGHTWPGAADDAGGVGPTTHEIDANELIWQFFKDHPKP